MRVLSATNPFQAGSQEYLAYQHAYALASAHMYEHYAISGRVLGHMLQELPWDEGRLKMASEINSCADDQSLVELGIFYINHFLCIFRSATEHPSCPCFDDEHDMNSDVITEAWQNYHTTKSQALKRDGYQCMLSGRLDANIERELQHKITEAVFIFTEACEAAVASTAAPLDNFKAKIAATLTERSAKLDVGAQEATAFLANFPVNPSVCTNAAYIFPESTNADIGKKAKDYAGVWAMMERFGQNGFRDELDGSNIHRLGNILTLDHTLHDHFDKLALWLEADDMLPHTYRICSTYDAIIKGLPSIVTFMSHHPNFGSSDLPDCRYLQMHAACCRIANMSGVTGYLDDNLEKEPVDCSASSLL